MNRIRSVLFATDLSKASRRAFAAAVALARTNRAGLTILHVILPLIPMVPEETITLGAWRDIEAETRTWAKTQVGKLAESARKAGVKATVRIANGDPARQIVRIARTAEVDLIVIGTHGRTGMSRLLMGSVAQRVIGTAPCPVLTVRARDGSA